MRISCVNCQTAYNVADEKIPPGGARANCPECGQEIFVPGVKDSGSSPPLSGNTSVDYGQTMAFDFQEIDQSRSEASHIRKDASEREPFFAEGFRYSLREAVSGRTFSIGRPQVTIGRSGVDINLDDPEVSRKHCIIQVFGDHLVVIDDDSTNGTFVGDRKIMISRLQFGDTFTVGNTAIEVMAYSG